MTDAPMPDDATTPEPGPEPEPAPELATDTSVAAAPEEGIADAAGLAASEEAANERAATAAAVALVAATAFAHAEAAATAAAVAVPDPSLADADQVARRSRRAMVRGTFTLVVHGMLVLALFLGGIALGTLAFQRSDQGASTVPTVDPGVDGASPPAVVEEFVSALAGGDADSLRSSLLAEPHARLIGEFRRFDIQSIASVETLGTHVDGTRSATEVVMRGTTTTGVPISLNLIILTDGNTIEGFR